MVAKLFAAQLLIVALVSCAPIVDDSGANSQKDTCDTPQLEGGCKTVPVSIVPISPEKAAPSGQFNPAVRARIKQFGADSRVRIKKQQSGSLWWERTGNHRDVAQCEITNFGDNSLRHSNDGECDDPRFAGPGVDHIVLSSDRGKDANDCRALCENGSIWLK